MRVLCLTNLYPPHFLGGYELLCRDVTEALRARGHEVAVLTSDHGGSGETTPYPVWRMLELTRPLDRAPRVGVGRRVQLTRRNAAVASRVLRAVRPDVVFAWNQNRITLGPLYQTQAEGYPVVLTLNDEHMGQFAPAAAGGGLRRTLRRCAERWVEPRLTFTRLDLRHATCISAALRDNLTRAGFPGERLEVIHQGVPLQAFQPRSDAGGLGRPARVLYAGGLHPDKGVDHVVRAVAALRAGGRPVALRIVGSGRPSDEARLRALVAATCGPADVEFQPRVPREAMPAVYRAADLFVFPSVWAEPFGLTHLEAMACGVPVVATAVGGCRELLRAGQNALVVPPADPPAITEALGRLLDDAPLRRRLVAGGLETVARLNLDRYVDDLTALLERARAAGGRAA